MPITIPLGPHFFTPEALQKAFDATEKELKPGAKGAAVATVDVNGARVGVVFHNDNGWQAQFAFSHEWSGDSQIGGKLIKSW